MHRFTDTASLKRASLRKQPLFGKLIRELRSLTNTTQGQFAATIGVSYVTVSRWEVGRIQPSELALRQVQALIERLNQSTSGPVQARSEALLASFIADMQA